MHCSWRDYRKENWKKKTFLGKHKNGLEQWSLNNPCATSASPNLNKPWKEFSPPLLTWVSPVPDLSSSCSHGRTRLMFPLNQAARHLLQAGKGEAAHPQAASSASSSAESTHQPLSLPPQATEPDELSPTSMGEIKSSHNPGWQAFEQALVGMMSQQIPSFPFIYFLLFAEKYLFKNTTKTRKGKILLGLLQKGWIVRKCQGS